MCCVEYARAARTSSLCLLSASRRWHLTARDRRRPSQSNPTMMSMLTASMALTRGAAMLNSRGAVSRSSVMVRARRGPDWIASCRPRLTLDLNLTLMS